MIKIRPETISVLLEHSCPTFAHKFSAHNNLPLRIIDAQLLCIHRRRCASAQKRDKDDCARKVIGWKLLSAFIKAKVKTWSPTTENVEMKRKNVKSSLKDSEKQRIENYPRSNKRRIEMQVVPYASDVKSRKREKKTATKNDRSKIF